MTHLLPLWDLIFTIALLILGGFFGMLYFAHRINKDTTYNFRGEYFTRAVKVWHSPEEEPKAGRHIIVNCGGHSYKCYCFYNHIPWPRFVLLKRITRWAYISDLEKLPGYNYSEKNT